MQAQIFIRWTDWTAKSNAHPTKVVIVGSRTEDLAPRFQFGNSVYCLIIHQFSLDVDFDLWIPVLSPFPAMSSWLNYEVLLSNLISAAPSGHLSRSLSYLYNSFSGLLRPLEFCWRLFNLSSFCNSNLHLWTWRIINCVVCDMRTNMSN